MASTHREIISDIKKGNPAPVYILSGSEPYFLDLITGWLEEKVVPEEDRDFDQTVLYGSDASVEQVVAAAQQYPLMAGRRLVVFKEAQAMANAKAQLQKLEGYVRHANTTTVLAVVFKGEELPAASKLAKAVKEAGGVFFTSPKIKEYQLAAPVRDYCQEKRIGIDNDAIDILVQNVGSSLDKLFSEIDKLAIACGEGKRITKADVLENIGMNKEFNVYELTHAIARKDYGKAMEIARYFRSNPKKNPVVLVTPLLFKFFAQLTMIHFAKDRTEQGLMELLRFRSPWQLKDHQEALRHYTASQAVEAVGVLRELDCQSKGIGSMRNEYDLLDETIFKLVTLQG